MISSSKQGIHVMKYNKQQNTSSLYKVYPAHKNPWSGSRKRRTATTHNRKEIHVMKYNKQQNTSSLYKVYPAHKNPWSGSRKRRTATTHARKGERGQKSPPTRKNKQQIKIQSIKNKTN